MNIARVLLFHSKVNGMKIHESFNQSEFARFINTPEGRILRMVAGFGFLVAGCVKRRKTVGMISLVWGLLPLSAGLLDLCFVSAVLGGPLSGKKIRQMQAETEPAI
jgi:hypothetical protein